MTKFSLLVLFLMLWRMILPLDCKWHYKVPLTVLAGVIAFKFKLIRILGGNYFSPDLPGWFILLMAWLFAILFILSVMIIPIDLVLAGHTLGKIVRQYVQEKKADFSLLLKKHKLLNKVHSAALVIAILTASVGMYFGLAMPRIRYITVKCADLPAEAENIKISVLADLHVDNFNRSERIKKIVALANTLDPDLVFMVGDFVDGRKQFHLDALSELKNLRSRHGVFSVVGNHEYYSGYKMFMEHFKKLGLPVLENESVYLDRFKIRICGITDIQAKRYKFPVPDLPRALAGNPGDFKILLSHRPDTAAEAEKLGAVIQFSGHTHGGMVRGFDHIVAALNGGYAWGENQIGRLMLIISNGTCIWSSFPIRLGRPGEILLVTLKKK